MNEKLLVKVTIPDLEADYDIFIPPNELIWKVTKLITKIAFDLSGINIDVSKSNYMLMNKRTGYLYKNNDIIIDTDIKNGTELFLIPIALLYRPR